MRRHISAAILVLSMAGGCGFAPYSRCENVAAGDSLSCPTPGVSDRAFDLVVPTSWDGQTPLPLIYAFHGGGGRRSAAESLTCPDGDTSDPACLAAKAIDRGYVLVRPDGTGSRPFRNLRTWNAGGGRGEWSCVSAGACRAHVDDMAYLDIVHEELNRLLPIDPDRVFATGISNGGAISHRLACERSERMAAIAPVAGENQFAAAGGACPGGVALLQLHGTEDPIWEYETSTAGGVIPDDKLKVGAEESTAAWAQRNGCDATFTESALPDPIDDGTSAFRIRYENCSSPVELIRIEGGGHTWPQGDPYLSTSKVGRVSQDFDGDDLILDFFDAQSR